MKVFEILVYSIVALALIFLIAKFFIFPKASLMDQLKTPVIKALDEPGKVVEFKFRPVKDEVVMQPMLAQRLRSFPVKPLFRFYGSDDYLTRDWNGFNNATVRLLKGSFLGKGYVICYPSYFLVKSVIEEDYEKEDGENLKDFDAVCNIYLGLKPDFDDLSLKVRGKQKKEDDWVERTLEGNFSDGYLKVVVVRVDSFNVDQKFALYELWHDSESRIYDVFVFKPDRKISFRIFETGKFLIYYVLVSPKGNFVYDYEFVETHYGYEEAKKGCVAKNAEFLYEDVETKEKVYKLNCENCLLPSMCADAWANKGYKVEAINKDYAYGRKKSGGETYSNKKEGLAWPAISNYVTSCFGYRPNIVRKGKANHAGIDIRGNYGSDVYAIADGKVMGIGKTYGTIYVYHPELGFYSKYVHLSRILVKEGETVKKGQKIGEIGGQGPYGPQTYAPHLHFGILVKAKPLGNIDSLPEEDVYLNDLYPKTFGSLYAINPLCLYSSDAYVINKDSVSCTNQGGPRKWCSYYTNLIPVS